jgi:triosephosphate isomerase
VSRRPIVAGNIKMFLTAPAVLELLRGVRSGLGGGEAAEVAYFPPFTALADAGRLLAGSPIALGGQNLHWEAEGAFTGEVSARMLLDVGCRWALVGHSERRQFFGETDATVRRKIDAALEHGLSPMVCVGETLAERESGATEDVLARQVAVALEGLSDDQLARMAVAYEPVWAIGTGKTATPELAQAAHEFLRREIGARTSTAAAARLRLLYGGSVKPDNAAGLLGQPDIDGALVGGACLAPASFLGIIRAAG